MPPTSISRPTRPMARRPPSTTSPLTSASSVASMPVASGMLRRIFRRSRHPHIYILILCDLLVILLSTMGALWGRSSMPALAEAPDVELLVAQIAVPLSAGWLAILALSGAYSVRNHGVGTSEYNRVLGSSLVTAGALGVISYLAQIPLSRAYYVLLFAIGVPLLLISRVSIRRLVHALRRRRHLSQRVIVAGAPHRTAELIDVVRRESWLGYHVVGQALSTHRESENDTVPVIGDLANVVQAVENAEADVVIFTEGAFPTSAHFRRAVWELEQHSIDVVVVPGMTDISASRLQIRPVAGLPLVHVGRPTTQAANRFLKRLFDLIVTSLGLIVALPVMAIVALAIKMDDRGPVIFVQERVGRNGQTFRLLKFRSMVVDAEARLADLARDNEGSGVLFKMTNDPRVTGVGKYIRKWSLDELPQLFNILIGQMSLVGPRPALPSEVARYDVDMRRRLEVRPGLTGLWQVSGRSNLSWKDTVRLDLYYTDNWSLLQDVSIIVRTVNAVWHSRGAF